MRGPYLAYGFTLGRRRGYSFASTVGNAGCPALGPPPFASADDSRPPTAAAVALRWLSTRRAARSNGSRFDHRSRASRRPSSARALNRLFLIASSPLSFCSPGELLPYLRQYLTGTSGKVFRSSGPVSQTNLQRHSYLPIKYSPDSCRHENGSPDPLAWCLLRRLCGVTGCFCSGRAVGAEHPCRHIGPAIAVSRHAW